MKCKICKHQTQFIFDAKVLNKYMVHYYQCEHCLFLQTEEPYWLDEAYSSGAISALDTGILARNIFLTKKTSELVENICEGTSNFTGLDYGGGEGIFVRMMRDRGFNFFLQDKYATNLYARLFDLRDIDKKNNFSVLTAFELFEHLPDPLEEINRMFQYSDIIIFSTELKPNSEAESLSEWWYIVPETGQHVSFYHLETLKFIADDMGVFLYTNRRNLHIFSKKKLPKDPFQTKPLNLFQKIKGLFSPVKNVKRTSLTQKDFDFVKSKLKQKDQQSI